MNSVSGRDTTRSESYYVTKLVYGLKSSGYRPRKEVPNLSQSVDIVATKGRWVYAIEVKLHNWRVALRQAGSHEAFADFVCIAVTTKQVSPILIMSAEERGYGLLRYDFIEEEFIWLRKPRRNMNYWSHHRKLWAKVLKDIDYAD